ncbi:hypothetical protein [Brevibacillus laterosporus]|uniref:Uncharacterized protein n=1 Tax=Brevibacillus laterosporus TaxID=1465 RepID=A0AAP3GDN6_BRELA|nr:hypothetical protein [Brevibacillus laterosporus]MCR8981165.1 hypothetical protein [Brevibacillus laterosporus]MCZ0808319.1 hypothetical protein [Brevibacillus laterosporus]MCZ0826757.1 hypothetical protein [Brevibacillus laterosporus]MCZ0850570.1 hypothetical protein [Brevibacillus laterosporus]
MNIKLQNAKPLSQIRDEKDMSNITPELLAAYEAIAKLDEKIAFLEKKILNLEGEKKHD